MSARAQLIHQQLQAQYEASHMKECRAGCGTPIWVGKDYCERCTEEIEALNQMAWARAQRRPWYESLLEAWLHCWEWIEQSPLTDWAVACFVLGSIMFISVKYGQSIAAWLNALAGVK